MKRTKTYERTRFASSTLLSALELLGPKRSLIGASIELPGETAEYESEERFLKAYASNPANCMLSAHSGKVYLRVVTHLGQTRVGVEAAEEATIDNLLALFESAAGEARLPESPEPLDVSRMCEPAPLHWETLPHLTAHLASRGISVESQSVELSRHPDTMGYSAWAPALDDIRKNGEPKRFWIRCYGTGPAGRFQLTISRQRYSDVNEFYLRVGLTGVPDIQLIDDVVTFLGLEAEQSTSVASLPRSAFIAHRFDSEAEQIADRLARFLELLRFDVKTGRGFSPESVGQKVRKRIESQAIIFIILTPGEDATWLTQETILGYAKEKRLIILRERSVTYKPALLGDLEYIPFEGMAIERAFIPILEGLRELGFLSFEK